MLNLNNYICTGRLTRDPETKYLPSGKQVCNFAIAVNNPYQSGGEWKQDTTFLDVSCFDKTAERAADLSKGDGVCVEGKLKQENWERDGVKHSKIKVQANSVKSMKEAESGTSGRSERVHAENYTQQPNGPSRDLHFEPAVSDDVPF